MENFIQLFNEPENGLKLRRNLFLFDKKTIEFNLIDNLQASSSTEQQLNRLFRISVNLD